MDRGKQRKINNHGYAKLFMRVFIISCFVFVGIFMKDGVHGSISNPHFDMFHVQEIYPSTADVESCSMICYKDAKCASLGEAGNAEYKCLGKNSIVIYDVAGILHYTSSSIHNKVIV